MRTAAAQESIVVASFGSVQAAVDAVLRVTGRLRPRAGNSWIPAINAVEDTARMDLDGRDTRQPMLVAGF